MTKIPRCRVTSNYIYKLNEVPSVPSVRPGTPQPDSEVHQDTDGTGSRLATTTGQEVAGAGPDLAQTCQLGISEVRRRPRVRPHQHLWCFTHTLQFQKPDLEGLRTWQGTWGHAEKQICSLETGKSAVTHQKHES